MTLSHMCQEPKVPLLHLRAMKTGKRTTQIFKQINYLVIGTCFLWGAVCPAQEKKAPDGIHKAIQARTDAIFDSLVLVRRDLHRHPEISGQEKMDH